MKVKVAATQMACTWDMEENLATAERLVRQAAGQGANVILLQEMFATHSSPSWIGSRNTSNSLTRRRQPDPEAHGEAGARTRRGAADQFLRTRQQRLLQHDHDDRRSGPASLASTASRTFPMGPPGCFEKVYTSEGDTGFKVWPTSFGNLGVGVCWDQWFPESARCMCVMGADLLFYPTGIGSDCHDHWQTVMLGHAGANLTPLVCSNRIGTESGEFGATDLLGPLLHRRPQRRDCRPRRAATGRRCWSADFDLEANREMRANWGVFRDRRPDLYGPLTTLDGKSRQKSSVR